MAYGIVFIMDRAIRSNGLWDQYCQQDIAFKNLIEQEYHTEYDSKHQLLYLFDDKLPFAESDEIQAIFRRFVDFLDQQGVSNYLWYGWDESGETPTMTFRGNLVDNDFGFKYYEGGWEPGELDKDFLAGLLYPCLLEHHFTTFDGDLEICPFWYQVSERIEAANDICSFYLLEGHFEDVDIIQDTVVVIYATHQGTLEIPLLKLPAESFFKHQSSVEKLIAITKKYTILTEAMAAPEFMEINTPTNLGMLNALWSRKQSGDLKKYEDWFNKKSSMTLDTWEDEVTPDLIPTMDTPTYCALNQLAIFLKDSKSDHRISFGQFVDSSNMDDLALPDLIQKLTGPFVDSDYVRNSVHYHRWFNNDSGTITSTADRYDEDTPPEVLESTVYDYALEIFKRLETDSFDITICGLLVSIAWEPRNCGVKRQYVDYGLSPDRTGYSEGPSVWTIILDTLADNLNDYGELLPRTIDPCRGE